MEKGRGKGTDTLQRDNDYLRRGDVKRLLENVVCLHEELPAQIDLIPAADVAPARHGKWVKATGMMPPEYCGLHICSECGHYAGRKPPYGGREMLSDYCPHCGARMDGDGDV